MKNKVLSFVLVITCIFAMAVPMFAAETRESAQIKLYSMEVTPGDGTLDVEFAITGKGPMTKIGCESIYVYKKVGTSWIYVTDRDEDDTGMSKSNTYAHMNMISIPCTAGVQYKVEVTLFAENAAGRDARSDEFFLTGT